MGYMDMLKDAIGMNNSESKVIDGDGKQYTFTPGPNGALVAAPKVEPQPLLAPTKPIAKTLPVRPPVQVASTRG